MTTPVPPSDDQPTYVDPVTGQPLYVNPITGELAYADPNAVAPTLPYPAAGYTPPNYTAPTYTPPTYTTPDYATPGFAPGSDPQAAYPTSPGGPADPSMPQTGFTAPEYSPSAYAPPAFGYPGYTAYPPGAIGIQNRTNPLAITSMVLSICGVPMLFCYGFGGLLALAGAIIGHVARRQVRTRMEAGDGMALAGIIIGWITVAIGIVVAGFIIWAIVHFSNATPDDPFPYPS